MDAYVDAIVNVIGCEAKIAIKTVGNAIKINCIGDSSVA